MKRGKRAKARKRKNRTRQRRRSVRAPAARSIVTTTNTPLERLRFRHREYYDDVVQSVSGAQEQEHFKFNPGVASNVPWLARIAHSFEKYKLHSLTVEYVPAVGTSTAGMVGIAPDYDALDDNSVLSKGEILSFADAVRGPVWTPLNCVCRHLPNEIKYVRAGPPPKISDLKTYDVVQFSVAHSAHTTGAVGELWFNYDIELLIPQHSKDEVPGAYFGMPDPADPTKPWETPTATQFNDCGAVIEPDYGSGNRYINCAKMPPGHYLIEQDGTGTGVTGINTPSLSGATGSDSLTVLKAVWNASSGIWTYVWSFVKDSVYTRLNDLRLYWTGIPSTAAGPSNLRITQISDEFA